MKCWISSLQRFKSKYRKKSTSFDFAFVSSDFQLNSTIPSNCM